MTDYAYDDEDDTDDTESEDRTVNLNRQQIRSLERDAKRARKADEELAALRRENAFIKAGIDPSTDPKLTYFVDGYKGEVDAVAIRSAAEAAGFLTVTDTADEAAHDRISAASAGATQQGKPDQVAELREAARTGGKEAVLAKIREHGHNIVQ